MLEINYKKNTGKFTNMWRLNNILLNNQRVTEEIKGGIKIYIETNKNGNTMYQNLWYETKVVLRGKFIEINAYPKKLGKSK